MPFFRGHGTTALIAGVRFQYTSDPNVILVRNEDEIVWRAVTVQQFQDTMRTLGGSHE